MHIRIYIKGKPRAYFPIRIPGNVTKKQWSGTNKSWIANMHPYAFEANQDIDEKLTALFNLNRRYMVAKKQLTMQRIYKELKGNNNQEIFNNFFEQILKNPPEAMSDGNRKRYNAALTSLNLFNNKVPFFELDEEFFLRLKKHQQEKQDLDASTIRGYFNAYKKVMKWARFDAYVSKEKEKEVFEGIKHKGADKTDNDHLEVHEVLEWQNFVFPEELKHYNRDRDLFLLLIFTGYYYSDLKTLLKTELRIDPDYGYYLYSGIDHQPLL